MKDTMFEKPKRTVSQDRNCTLMKTFCPKALLYKHPPTHSTSYNDMHVREQQFLSQCIDALSKVD